MVEVAVLIAVVATPVVAVVVVAVPMVIVVCTASINSGKLRNECSSVTLVNPTKDML